jgi:hypothetical protein
MPAENVAELFDEFVEAYVGTKNPDVRDYLGRAGAASDELGALIDRFLELAPVKEPDAETIVAMNVRLNHETALTAARIHRRLKVDDLVERLRVALGLSDSTRPQLRQAYQELEGDQLNLAGVHGSVWEALQGILGLDVRRLAGTARRPAFGAPLYARPADFSPEPREARPVSAASGESDDVDRLFRGHV